MNLRISRSRDDDDGSGQPLAGELTMALRMHEHRLLAVPGGTHARADF